MDQQQCRDGRAFPETSNGFVFTAIDASGVETKVTEGDARRAEVLWYDRANSSLSHVSHEYMQK